MKMKLLTMQRELDKTAKRARKAEVLLKNANEKIMNFSMNN